eukprot:scaffold23473_cov47-Phaeocystis_antarctica.AAC.1
MSGATSVPTPSFAEASEALGRSASSRFSAAAASALPLTQMRKVSSALAASRVKATAAGGTSASEAMAWTSPARSAAVKLPTSPTSPEARSTRVTAMLAGSSPAMITSRRTSEPLLTAIATSPSFTRSSLWTIFAVPPSRTSTSGTSTLLSF